MELSAAWIEALILQVILTEQEARRRLRHHNYLRVIQNLLIKIVWLLDLISSWQDLYVELLT